MRKSLKKFKGKKTLDSQQRGSDRMIKLELPVYWQTRKNKITLMSLNWYRNENEHVKNKIKHEYHDLIRLKLLKNKEKIKGKYQVRYRYFYKNSGSDLENVASVIGKFMNDALKELGIIVDDSVKYLVNSQLIVDSCDKKNPRMEIEVEEIE